MEEERFLTNSLPDQLASLINDPGLQRVWHCFTASTVFYFVFICLWAWTTNPRPHISQAGTLPLNTTSPVTSSVFLNVIGSSCSELGVSISCHCVCKAEVLLTVNPDNEKVFAQHLLCSVMVPWQPHNRPEGLMRGLSWGGSA